MAHRISKPLFIPKLDSTLLIGLNQAPVVLQQVAGGRSLTGLGIGGKPASVASCSLANAENKKIRNDPGLRLPCRLTRGYRYFARFGAWNRSCFRYGQTVSMWSTGFSGNSRFKKNTYSRSTSPTCLRRGWVVFMGEEVGSHALESAVVVKG
ncbi:hypothetical protein [Cyclobacterium xiamenense]|uniref:hypothetical protein n=1 Tax=Cyclobacterium xiamenense TaxID=1297121 RepID=UPI0035D0AFFE